MTRRSPRGTSSSPRNPDQDAVLPLGWGNTGSGGGAPTNGSGVPDARRGRNLTKVIYEYWDGARRRHGEQPARAS